MRLEESSSLRGRGGIALAPFPSTGFVYAIGLDLFSHSAVAASNGMAFYRVSVLSARFFRRGLTVFCLWTKALKSLNHRGGFFRSLCAFSVRESVAPFLYPHFQEWVVWLHFLLKTGRYLARVSFAIVTNLGPGQLPSCSSKGYWVACGPS